jgi:hypothetical protein
MVLVLSFHPLDLLDPALMLITLVLCPNDRHPQKVMKHYIYIIDLIWVWSGWRVSIITCSILQVRTQVNVLLSPLCVSQAKHVLSVWGWILMTTSQSSRFWIVLCMYKEDLLWVWKEWGASIIRTKRDPPTTPRRSILRSQRQISECGGILMTSSRCSRCWIALFMYKEDLLWVWSGWGASIITYSILQVRTQVNCLLPPLCVRPSRYYQCGVASLWPRAQIEGAETLYICLKKISYEYEVYELPQS